MKKLIFISLLILFYSCDNQTKEKAKITKVFSGYIKAILGDNGKTAYTLIDKHTKDYYKDMLRLSLIANKEKVKSLSLVNKLMVFALRHRLDKKKLISMTAKDLIIYAVENGWVGKNSVMNLEIGKITISNSFAKAKVIVSQKETPMYYHFYKESGRWKIDLTEMMKWGELGLKKVMEKSGKDEDQFIFSILEAISGKKVDSKIWKPIK